MNYLTDVIIGFTIVIPALIGLIRFKKLDRSFLPFVCLLWFSVLNELVSFISVKLFSSNTVNYNVFALFESLLITWQFKRWKLFEKSQGLYGVILIGLMVSWAIEVFFVFSINTFVSYFIIIYSFIIVLMSISTVNGLITKEHSNLLRNSIFILCVGFIVYFTYAIGVEIFLMYGITQSGTFMIHVFAILAYLNLFINLLFTLAIVWTPTRQIFITPS